MTLSWTHVHLLLNHFPIIGAIAALVIFVVGWIRHSRPIKQTSYWMFMKGAAQAIAIQREAVALNIHLSLPMVKRDLNPVNPFQESRNRVTVIATLMSSLIGLFIINLSFVANARTYSLLEALGLNIPAISSCYSPKFYESSSSLHPSS